MLCRQPDPEFSPERTRDEWADFASFLATLSTQQWQGPAGRVEALLMTIADRRGVVGELAGPGQQNSPTASKPDQAKPAAQASEHRQHRSEYSLIARARLIAACADIPAVC